MAYVDRDRSRETALSGIGAAALVSGIGFVMVTGLAMRVVQRPDAPLTVHEWAAPTPPPPPPPPEFVPERANHARIATAVTPERTVVPPVSQDATISFPTADRTVAGVEIGAVPTQLPPPPAADHSSRAIPRGDPGSWVTSDDYPASALRAEQEGRTGFRLDIGADGRASACTVTSPSGSDALDQAACRMLMRRARFEPARDAAGAPTVATYTSRVSWRLPAE